MTMNKIISCRHISFDVQISRNVSEKVKTCLKNRNRNPDEGGLLVEVLVGMLILVIVFTATTIALSSMAEQRVYVEQRDQAVALLSTYEEQSRIFRCGLVVDVIDSNLVDPAVPSSGTAKLNNDITKCDFAAKENSTPPANPGDQTFVVSRQINEINSQRTFQIDIRYWWEIPGSSVHRDSCNVIQLERKLPSILTRAIRVQWVEKGVPRQEMLIKRDAVPNDDVVFASGNRKNVLARISPSPPPSGSTSSLSLGAPGSVVRILDGIMGQPEHCVWFPYITPNNTQRVISGIGVGTASIAAIDSAEPQGSVIAS